MIPRDLKTPLGELKPPLLKFVLTCFIVIGTGLVTSLTTLYFIGNNNASSNTDRADLEKVELRKEKAELMKEIRFKDSLINDCKDDQISDFQMRAAAQKTLDSTERILNRLR